MMTDYNKETALYDILGEACKKYVNGQDLSSSLIDAGEEHKKKVYNTAISGVFDALKNQHKG